MTPYVSVIIPTFNRAHCIRATIESVLAQSFRDFEVIVIDDGSTDNTISLLRQYTSRIKVLSQENRGLCRTRNRGVQEAQGEWIAFLDSDDLWLPTKLEAQVNAVRSRPHVSVHITNATIFREHLAEELDLFGLTGLMPQDGCSISHLPRPLIPCISKGLAWMQCAFVRRSTFLSVGDFDPKLKVFMDFEMGSRLAMTGPWELNHTPLVRILRNDSHQVESISSRSRTTSGRLELVDVYNRMQFLSGLSKEEKTFLARRVSDARSGLGFHYFKNGEDDLAVFQIEQSFRDYPRAGTFAKLILSRLPRSIRYLLLRRLFPLSSN